MILTKTTSKLRGKETYQIREHPSWEAAVANAVFKSEMPHVIKVEIFNYASDPNDYSEYKDGKMQWGYRT